MNQSVKGEDKSVKGEDKSVKGEGKKKKMPEEHDDDDELFMAITPQEKKAWEKMMATRITAMKKNHTDSQKWKDNLTRRRMFILSRIRKLHAAQMDRFRFLLKMAETMKHINESRVGTGNENNDEGINPANDVDNEHFNPRDNKDNVNSENDSQEREKGNYAGTVYSVDTDTNANTDSNNQTAEATIN